MQADGDRKESQIRYSKAVRFSSRRYSCSVAFHRLTELGPINNVGPLYFNLVGRIGVTVCYCMTDLIQYFKSGNNVAKDSIFTVLRRNWPETDIKLAAVRKPFWIYVVGKAAHCHRAAHMF